MNADQTLSPIFPTTWLRGSSELSAGVSMRKASSQSAWAAIKSIPCFALFEDDLASSNSKFIGIEMVPFLYMSSRRPYLPLGNELDVARPRKANVELIRVNDGEARAPHETCLRQTSDPMIG
jgi:hypothetical protein